MKNTTSIDNIINNMRLPAIIAPMFLISGPELVIAAGKSGIIGAFPAPNARTIGDLRKWLEHISTELDQAGKSGMWAINMIVHNTYERFSAELELICEFEPRIVITALGSPAKPLEQVHAYGGLVFSDVISPDQARKALDAGADGLVLVSTGAGGHTGEYSAMAFVEEVRGFWDGPLIIGGGISTGRSIHAAMALGANFAYMGTRFIACRESLVSDANREMLVRARMQDIVTTKAITGVPANWMRESLEQAGFTKEMLAVPKKIDFSNLHGDSKAWKNIWGAGHGVSNIKAIQPVAEVVDQLADEFTKSIANLERFGPR